MPGKIKVKVLAGRNLPVMDRASDTTDAFVEIKFGSVTHKTDVCRKTLNPHWNSTEWYRFEVDESELQDEPLQLRLMDHDTYSANDAIGKVVISLAPLLAREANNIKGAGPSGAVLSGWIPVFDTMHGIRGELHVIVKVELFSDFNKYKTSSCGVQFFHSSAVPPGYRATAIHGFVEELVVNDDPEYQWIDKIRTPRASNEARQVAFIKLSNQVQRLVGLKAAELGANAVVGYQQDFDLEGEAGVVARAIGTAVSLTPPPTPSQSFSIPPCTQQQLRKYLDILATDDESITDLNQYFQSHREELQKLLNIMNPKTPLLDDPENVEEDEKRDFTRQSSIKSYTGWYQDDYLSQNSLKHISEDQTELNKLLKRSEESDSDSTGTLQKIKKLKTNFTRRLGSLRTRKTDKPDDTISLQSNSSDNSRISLTDLKNEFKKFKRIKKPKFRKTFTNNEDEGVGMASILARSVIHAHTSLACIAEKESEHSPSSTMRRTSESEPTINVSDDERKPGNLDLSTGDKYQAQSKAKVPEIHTSLKNVNIEVEVIDTTTRQRRLSESCPTTPLVERSENLLKLPGETGYFGSLSLSGESSVYSSSDDDEDESSDLNADAEKSVETTSSVVQCVLNNDVNPVLIAHVERKLSILDGTVPELKGSKSHGILRHNQDLNYNTNLGTSKSSPCINENEGKAGMKSENVLQPSATTSENTSKNLNTPATQRSNINLHFNFHNPFTYKKVSKSMSAPSSPVERKSFVYRSSKRIKHQLSKISKSHMFKSLSHYSLISRKKDHVVKIPLSEPGSTSDVPSKVPSHETVLGSPFLSYADLMSLDNNESDSRKKSHHTITEDVHSKVKMYIGSEPVSRASLSGPPSSHYKDDGNNPDQKYRKDMVLKPTGLVHTALETVLIDKVQSILLPTSKANQSREQQFFNDVNKKLGQVEEARNLHSQHFYEDPSVTDNRDDFLMSIHNNNVSSAFLSLPATPAVIHGLDNQFFDEYQNTHKRSKSKERKHKNESLIETAMKTVLIDKVQSLMPPTSEPVNIINNPLLDESKEVLETSHNKHRDKDHSLVYTAMETILIDKIQALLPPSVEPVDTDEEHMEEYEQTKSNATKHTSLFNTAMETMLLEKAQVLIPATSEGVTFDCVSRNSVGSNASHLPKKVENAKYAHGGLVHTAMETILLDKAQSLTPSTSEIMSTEIGATNNSASNILEKAEIKKGKGDVSLLHTAMETILMDKVQALIPTSSESLSFDSTIKNDVVSYTSQVQDPVRKDDVLLKISASSEDVLPKNESITKHMLQIQADTIDGKIIVDRDASDVASIMPASKTKIHGNVFDVKDDVGQNKSIKDRYSKKNEIFNACDIKEYRLVRQDSIHSFQENYEEPQKMSKETSANVTVSPKVTHSKPFLQHFHPILSGPPLETIPSLPETHSLDHTESLDVDGVERTCDCQTECQCKDSDSETNSASVCDNSHAACGVDRNEREKEKCDTGKEIEREKGSPRHARHESYGGREPVGTSQNSSFTPSTPLGMHRRSSDSDLSVTPKGGSLNASIGNAGSGGGAILRPSMNSSNIEMLEYPFLTMTDYPPGLIVHVGGTVCARSVKLVDPGGESAARAAWWAELRTELRAHARALRCNAVIAYTESAAICEDVCVLSASGTAAVINLDCDFVNELDAASALLSNGCRSDDIPEPEECTIAHVPYSPGTGPYRAELSTCGGCRKARVPAVLLATCSKPPRLQAYSKAVTITALAARLRRAPPASEPGARDISDQLPFLEYELHKLLLAKLRMQGANALFSLKTQIAIGERCVMALASGTAVRLSTLPPPTPPRIKASENDKDALEIQRALWDSFTANKAYNGYDIGGSVDHIPNGPLPESEVEDAPALDLCADKDACVLELDEAEDVETAKTLAARRMLMPVFTRTCKAAKGKPPQMFAQVWRARLVLPSQSGVGASAAAEKHVSRALDGVIYKLRRLQPCALVAPAFQIELPEDEIQLLVSGSAISLADPNNPEENVPDITYNDGNSNSGSSQQQNSNSNSQANITLSDNDDDIFALDEEQLVKKAPEVPPSEPIEDRSLILNGQAPTTVTLTTLSYVSGSRAEQRICALRLLFVRETTAVRELGGLSGFLHTFTCEVLAIVRAYTAALGGNALTSFYLTQLMLQDNAHKNQLLPDCGEAKARVKFRM